MTINVIMTLWSFAALAMVMVEAKKCEEPRSFCKCNGWSKKMRARKWQKACDSTVLLVYGWSGNEKSLWLHALP
jgi:hypothetical protein